MPSSISALKSVGVPPSTDMPLSLSFEITSGALSAVTISALSRVTIGVGRPGGPKKPNQDVGFRKAGSTSDMDGMAGRPEKRAGSSTARILMLLLSETASALEIERNAIGM